MHRLMKKEQLLTIPNLLSVVRLLLIFHRRCRLDRSFQAAAISAAAAILFRSFITLRSLENGGWYLTFAVTLCFVTDIFAYLTGRFLGRHKLIPAISPNKTVEGAVGGPYARAGRPGRRTSALRLEGLCGGSSSAGGICPAGVADRPMGRSGDVGGQAVLPYQGFRDAPAGAWRDPGPVRQRFADHSLYIFVLQHNRRIYSLNGGYRR